MPFGGFALLSLFYVFAGLRFLVKFLPHWRDTFARPLTQPKRVQLAEAAFFILVPVSVALHELGHAVAIKLYGGDILGFGYYFFAGYVSYDPSGFTDLQMMMIAFAGTLVNLILLAIALAAVYLKRPPFSPSVNEILTQFALISALNTLILYPLLDVATGMAGDWTQMYDGGVPWFTAVIVVIQIGTLLLLYGLSRNQHARQRLATVTGMPPGSERSLWQSPQQPAPAPAPPPPASQQKAMELTQQVASGWPERVNVAASIRSANAATATNQPEWTIGLNWQSADRLKDVIVGGFPDGRTVLLGADAALDAAPATRTPKPLRVWSNFPAAEEFGRELRASMETVESW